jgi:hypothetical protein
MYYLYLLRRVLCVVLPMLVGWALVQRLQVGMALLTAALIGATLSITGALLLRGSAVGKVTWRNYTAGWLLPWGYTLGRGQLKGIALVSGSLWTLLAAGAIYVSTTATAADSSAAPGAPAASISAWWLLLAWVVDGGCLLYLLGQSLKNSLRGSSAGIRLRKLLLALVAMLVGSLVLQLFGYTGLAVLVAGGPPLVLGGTYGLFLLMLLCLGRNAHWN